MPSDDVAFTTFITAKCNYVKCQEPLDMNPQTNCCERQQFSRDLGYCSTEKKLITEFDRGETAKLWTELFFRTLSLSFSLFCSGLSNNKY